MSLVELIAQADERGLAVSGLACLDRCLPLLSGDDELLRPLWAGLADGEDADAWGERLEQIRSKLGDGGLEEPGGDRAIGIAAGDNAAVGGPAVGDEAVLLARRMLAVAPPVLSVAEVRVWADVCSVALLRIHRLLGGAAPGEADAALAEAALADARREGRTEGMPPLVAAELRRQVVVLELLAEHGAGGLRRALEVSTEGRRVLRAVVSRRARGKRG
ncbi:hypothetical protein M2271_002754 [Streptomyces sp. LBL]|uniref:hypothetical protein n=1 Tax=Streptomyces sp. LBL TaxID=2940562 RepID=UPI002474E50D|nr:hypothetical protein [Streptomyces sp. LBL]MDH6624950.1 hypothetical protein [Streptomyces sp. LBL]